MNISVSSRCMVNVSVIGRFYFFLGWCCGGRVLVCIGC